MRNEKLRDMTYIAAYAAIYVVLWWVGKFIPFLQMPQGGSIELQLIAIFISSYHLGWKKGIGVAMLCWLITFILGSGRWYLNPMQYALDYFIPLLVVGLASLYFKNDKKYIVGVVIGMVLKFMSNVLSGVYYWPPEDGPAGSLAAWIYSLSYNSGYNLVTLIICVILVPLLINRLKKVNIEFLY